MARAKEKSNVHTGFHLNLTDVNIGLRDYPESREFFQKLVETRSIYRRDWSKAANRRDGEPFVPLEIEKYAANAKNPDPVQIFALVNYKRFWDSGLARSMLDDFYGKLPFAPPVLYLDVLNAGGGNFSTGFPDGPLGGMSPDRDTLLKAVSILLPVNNGGSVRLAVYTGGQLNGGPYAGSPAKLLIDFGQTPKGQTGWNTLEHAKGIRIPANTPIWLAWKSSGGKVEVAYFEERSGPSDFQSDRGRWDSKAIKLNSAKPWPRVWPAKDGGEFDSFEYSCLLTLEPVGNESELK